jgi:hypothetical protein
LALAAQIEGDEMAQVLGSDFPTQLQFEWRRPGAIGAGLLADLHHQIAILRPGINQLTAY